MFSGIVKITDLDDYIAPSQNCIKPLLDTVNNKKDDNDKKINNENNKNKKGKISIENEFINNNLNYDNYDKEISEFKNKKINNIQTEPDLIKVKDSSNKAAKVNLYDCLACSGCVTTAETILIEQHSIDEMLKNCLNNKENKKIVFTVSPQSVLSLARNYNIYKIECFKITPF